MGLMGGNRSEVHTEIHEFLADILTEPRLVPTLNIIDAFRIQFRNGPNSSSPNDVRICKTIVGGVDPVAVDSYAVQKIKELNGSMKKSGWIANAEKLGVGIADLSKIEIVE